ncbi:lipase family protein [Nocardia wallacei]|uniref:lipase family protein n=1 Tax=Nocardia wallacei TaxID=480035 RepID=UPI002456C69A|nr:lipase family protein [Nocardia wallacei]
MTDNTSTPADATAVMTEPDLEAPRAAVDDGRGGDLLRLEKTRTPQLDGAVDAWQVAYVSSDSYDEPIAASGTVLAPDNAGPGTPLLVYCPNFHGLGGPCAPSHLLATGQEPEADRIAAALARGWAVAVPDGEGLGIDGAGPHTFLAWRAAGHVTLDLARAATRLPDIDLGEAPIVICGYADGGRAATSAAALCPAYAPELDLRGVAAGAVVADPGTLVPWLAEGTWSMLGLAGLVGLSHAYRHLPLRHVLTEDGRRVADAAETATAAMLLDQYRRPLAHWCDRPDPWRDPLWRFVFAREATGLTGPQVPVHLYHGRYDTLVPVTHARRLYADYQALHVDVQWRDYPTGHFGAAAAGIDDALDFLDAVLSGAHPIAPDLHATQE